MLSSPTQTRDVLSFGPFSLVASERLLTRGGAAVELGARALDILIALASRPNQIIGKSELLAQVWPDVIVEEGSLRFHIANLRKALGDGRDGARYIATLTGRGYCFVAPVSRTVRSDRDRAATGLPHTNLPNRPVRIIGRGEEVEALARQLAAHRFVTIVGTGGVGKTTIAVELGHALADASAGAVLFVDLGMLADPRLVATHLASMLGLSVQSDDPTPGLVAFLRDKQVLLIFDTCEHLIDAVAALAAQIHVAAPQVHLLATSREPLQVEGERIYRLGGLASPAKDATDMTALVRTFPATELFIERAGATGAALELDDAEAAIVADICRQLDGVALAIELAARRVEAYGLKQIAAHLDQSLALAWTGPRDAPARHKTLRATLEWSDGLLSEPEREVLRALSVFVGDFTIEAALAVVAGPNVDQGAVFGAIDSLVAKSMVAARPVGAMMRYRLLDATRAYALESAARDAGYVSPAARHASYFRRWLEQAETASRIPSGGAERADHFAALNNVRAALEWTFGPDGDARSGVELAAAAAPVFLAMSLLPECRRWSAKAIGALDDRARGDRAEMQLQAALGVSTMFTHGGNDAALAALERSLAIAEAGGDAFDELKVLGPLQMFYLRTRDFTTALHYARRCSAAAETLQDPVASTMARSLSGISLHLGGEHGAARADLEAALRHAPRSQATTTIYIGFECRILAGAILARTLWFQGHPAEAVAQARRTIDDAAKLDHSLTLAIALIWGISVFLQTDDLETAQDHIEWLVSRAGAHSLTPYLAVGRAFGAELAIRRGDVEDGIGTLEECLKSLRDAPYAMLTTPFNIVMTQALTLAGRHAEGLALLEDTIKSVEEKGDACYMPELLRVRSRLLLEGRTPIPGEAEQCLVQSLAMSRRQGARAWELRAAIDLSELLVDQPERAEALLRPRGDQFEKAPM